MHRVLVLGAGKIGALISGLLADVGGYEVQLADVNADTARAVARAHGKRNVVPYGVDAGDPVALASHVAAHPCDAVISSLPFYCNPGVAKVAREHGLHYFDLTEDVEVTRAVRATAEGAGTAFVPQCGLAPGFISIAANELISHFDELRSIRMRVGALPQHPNNVLKYSLTWSTEGLINEYGNPCYAIADRRVVEAAPLEGLEEIEIDGTLYEAFNTSGGLGSLGETERVVIDVRRLAQEQRVELGDACVVLALDHLDREADLLGGGPKARQRLGVGRCQDLVGIVQDRQVVARGTGRACAVVRAGEVRQRRFLEEIVVVLGNLAEGDGRHCGEAPALTPLEGRPQERCGKLGEQRSRQAVVALGHVLPEVDAQLETIRADAREAAPHHVVELAVDGAHQGTALHVEHRHQAGKGLVAARRREKRDVVALALVAVGMAEVEDADTAFAHPFGVGQVVPCADDVHARDTQGPVALLTDDDDRSHAARLSGWSPWAR